MVSSAIDKYVYVILKERFDDKIILNWSRKEIVDSVDEIEHELIREAMKKVGVSRGVEITTLSDIPAEGSGLGSSSSVTVGVLHALYLYKGVIVNAERLAQEACEIEIDILKKPIGKQDQYIAAYGGLRYFEFKRDGQVIVDHLGVDPNVVFSLGSSLMLFYTGQVRNSAEILGQQKDNIRQNYAVLRKMKAQSTHLARLLRKGKGKASVVGRVMDEGWKLKKHLANGITNSVIDAMYCQAKEAGALGGKITGAGGGGFLLLYVPIERQDKVRKALKKFKELDFSLEKDGTRTLLNVRR